MQLWQTLTAGAPAPTGSAPLATATAETAAGA